MKASEFKKLIKEAVKEAIKEELLESIQQPPVQVQAPQDVPPPPVNKPIPTGNPMLDALNETRTSMSSEDYRNLTGTTLRSSLAQNYSRGMFAPKQNYTPASNDPATIAQSVASAPKVGLDLSQLGFVSKAAAIVDEAGKKDKARFGV